MNVDQFDFKLPDEHIALRPVEPRDASRLLVAKSDLHLEDRNFSDLLEYLRPGDGLVFNDTKVIPAQFEGVRVREKHQARISMTLHQRLDANRWIVFIKGAKKVTRGDVVSFGTNSNVCMAGALKGQIGEKFDEGGVELIFDLSGASLDEAMMTNGHMPLPPYIASKRQQDERDQRDYQTIYAAQDGAVAAPTAGLHFTRGLFDALEEKSITKHFVTLHVGAGTFLPVKVGQTQDHKMHYENGVIGADTADELNNIRERGGRIVSVGTTVLRLLESAVDANGKFTEWQGATNIFITPGHKISAIDLLITNFHLPRSTLFMLISAFSGLAPMQHAYAHAIKRDYRFYSYGDACLLYPQVK